MPTITFHVSSTRLYKVTEGASDVEVEDGYDGMLEGITITNDDGTQYDYWVEDRTVYASDKEEYDRILAAAEVANIMLPEDEDDFILFFSR